MSQRTWMRWAGTAALVLALTAGTLPAQAAPGSSAGGFWTGLVALGEQLLGAPAAWLAGWWEKEGPEWDPHGQPTLGGVGAGVGRVPVGTTLVDPWSKEGPQLDPWGQPAPAANCQPAPCPGQIP